MATDAYAYEAPSAECTGCGGLGTTIEASFGGPPDDSGMAMSICTPCARRLRKRLKRALKEEALVDR